MTGALPATVTARRRSTGSRLGPLPVVNLVLLEIGLAIGLALLAVDTALWWAALGILLVAAPLALGRWRGRWLVRWVQLTARYLARSRGPQVLKMASVTSPDPVAVGHPPASEEPILGSDNPQVALLRLVVPDLIVAHGADHRREPLGLAWHQGTWTAVLQVDAAPSLITPVGGTPNLPLGALAPCLEDRGVVLDAIQVIWHCYPGNAALPSSSPALRSYLEVLGPLPAAARRTTWVVLRLDPRRCLAAVAERGGGVMGAHRALIGALARVRSALEARDVLTRPLDADQLLRAGISAAELSAVAGTGEQVALSEGWTAVTAAGVGHAGYAISGWQVRGVAPNLTALTGVRALSTTVALSLSPGGDGAEVGLRGLVRVSARSHAELEAADCRLQAVSERLGVTLTPLHGLQTAGLAATLPLGVSG
ncbi:MAG: type VII secretion protein EccE [Pseudonocardiales bacterium]